MDKEIDRDERIHSSENVRGTLAPDESGSDACRAWLGKIMP
jgi:hypothetical protein